MRVSGQSRLVEVELGGLRLQLQTVPGPAVGEFSSGLNVSDASMYVRNDASASSTM